MKKLFFLLFILSSCIKTKTDAVPRHVFGQTFRPPITPIRDCKTGIPQTESQFSAHEEYIRTLGLRIMTSNPETFKGDYATERFCFRIVAAKDMANADLEFLTVTVFDFAFNIIKNDAEMASVLAHELAHITMQAKPEKVPPKIENNPEWHKTFKILQTQKNELEDSLLVTNTDFQNAETNRIQLQSELEALLPGTLKGKRIKLVLDYQRSTAQIKFLESLLKNDTSGGVKLNLEKEKVKNQSLRQELDSLDFVYQKAMPTQAAALFKLETANLGLNEKIREMQTQMRNKDIEILNFMNSILSAEELANWSEQVADEVGFELYIKAGFQPDAFVSPFKTVLERKDKALNTNDLQTCLHLLENEQSGGAVPARGSDDHPDYCWRIYNISLAELQTHEQYKALLPNALTLVVLPGQLEKLKLAIKTK